MDSSVSSADSKSIRIGSDRSKIIAGIIGGTIGLAFLFIGALCAYFIVKRIKRNHQLQHDAIQQRRIHNLRHEMSQENLYTDQKLFLEQNIDYVNSKNHALGRKPFNSDKYEVPNPIQAHRPLPEPPRKSPAIPEQLPFSARSVHHHIPYLNSYNYGQHITQQI